MKLGQEVILSYFGCVADFRRLYIGFSAVSTRQKTWRKTETVKIMSEDQKQRVTSFYPMTWLWFESWNFYLIIQNMVFGFNKISKTTQQNLCMSWSYQPLFFIQLIGRRSSGRGRGWWMWEIVRIPVTTSNDVGYKSGICFHIFSEDLQNFMYLD